MPISHAVRPGIVFGELIPGCVPEFEEREAAVYCNYTPMEFRGLPVGERARVVAQYRLHYIVQNHIEDAVNKASEQASRR